MGRKRMAGLESIKTSLRDWGVCNHPFRPRSRKPRAEAARRRAQAELGEIDRQMREVVRKIRSAEPGAENGDGANI